MLQTLFYVSRGGEEVGPFSVEDIRHQLSEGKLLAVDFVYVEEKEDWIPLSAFLAEEQENKTPVAQPLEERRQNHPPETFSLLPEELHTSHPEVKEEEQGEAKSFSPPVLQEITDAPERPEPHADSEHRETMPLQEITQVTKTIPQEFVLKQGAAEVILEDLRPGRIEVVVALEGEKAEHREELKVLGGDPHEVKVSMADSYHAGDKKTLTFEVVDEYGEPCMDFKGTLSFQLDQDSPIQVTLNGAKTEHSLECCRAGDHIVALQSVSPALKHAAEIPFQVLPGEPTTLKVQAAGALRAGGPQSVKIQAFDAFGNLATSYDGPLKVEVVEHPNTARNSGEPSLKIMPAPKKRA